VNRKASLSLDTEGLVCKAAVPCGVPSGNGGVRWCAVPSVRGARRPQQVTTAREDDDVSVALNYQFSPPVASCG
jgi:hypothetical protein